MDSEPRVDGGAPFAVEDGARSTRERVFNPPEGCT